jgi:hypothetical protein
MRQFRGQECAALGPPLRCGRRNSLAPPVASPGRDRYCVRFALSCSLAVLPAPDAVSADDCLTKRVNTDLPWETLGGSWGGTERAGQSRSLSSSFRRVASSTVRIRDPELRRRGWCGIGAQATTNMQQHEMGPPTRSVSVHYCLLYIAGTRQPALQVMARSTSLRSVLVEKAAARLTRRLASRLSTASQWPASRGRPCFFTSSGLA